MVRKLTHFVRTYLFNIFVLVLCVIWFAFDASVVEPILILIPTTYNLTLLWRTWQSGRLSNLLRVILLPAATLGLSLYWIYTGDNLVEPLIVLLNFVITNYLIGITSGGRREGVREHLLFSVKSRWSTSAIGSPLDEESYIPLRKTYENDLIDPLNRRPPVLPQYIHTNRPMIEILDEAKHLLILGEPGGGKTVTLQKLTSDLLERAEQDSNKPIPVYFELTEWAKEREPLETWLMKQFKRDYSLAVNDARAYLRGKHMDALQLVLLLDGLDEMYEDAMIQCVRFINDFLDERNLNIVRPQVVVCARFVEYSALPVRLKLNRAVRVNPLNEKQITEYIDRHLKRSQPATPDNDSEQTGSEKSTTVLQRVRSFFGFQEEDAVDTTPQPAPIPEQTRLREFLDIDDDIKQVLSSPLILTSTIYSGITLAELQSGSIRQRQNRVLNHYVDYVMSYRLIRSLDRRRVDMQLAWLAHHMGRNTLFSIEDIQPNWLRETLWRVVYLFFSRLIIALVISIALGLIVNGMLDNLVSALICAIVVTIVDLFRYRFVPPPSLPEYQRNYWHKFLRGTLHYFGVLIPLIIALATYYGTTQMTNPEDTITIAGVSLASRGVNLGIFLSLFYAAIFGVKSRKDTWDGDISTIEDLQPAFRDVFLSALIWSIFVGSIIGGLAGMYALVDGNVVITRWLNDQAALLPFVSNRLLAFVLIGFTVGGFAGMVFGVMFGGYRIYEDDHRRKSMIANPKEGLQRSLKNAFRNAILFGGVFALTFAALLFGVTNEADGAFKGILNGITVGMITFVSYGGAELTKHNVLRTIFFIKGLPFRYLDRLDEIKQSTLVRREGRGYRFYHPEVQEIFRDKPIFTEVFDARRALIVCGMITLLVVLGVGYQIGHWLLYSHDVPPGSVVVSGSAFNTGICLDVGEAVTIRSKGNLESGVYVGYIRPEGTEVGFVGLPLYDTYDIEPQYPHGTLMCRLEGERNWQRCVTDPPVLHLPFAWRDFDYVAPRSGCLEFRVNDTESTHHNGQFWVNVRQE